MSKSVVRRSVIMQLAESHTIHLLYIHTCLVHELYCWMNAVVLHLVESIVSTMSQ